MALEVFAISGTLSLKGAATTIGQLKQVNSAALNTATQISRVGQNIMAAGTSIQGFGRGMVSLGGKLTRSVTLPILALGGAVLKVGADFEKAMTESTAIMGNLSDDMRRQLEDTALAVSKTTRYSAKQAAESYFYLASAGLDAAQSMAVLPTVARFAQAGNFDMALATDLLTDAQSALGLTIRDDVVKNMANMIRVSDVLTKANILSNATVQQFSESLTNKAGAALRLLSKDVEEGAAVLAVYADQGLKGAAAGESLNIVMRDLQKASINNRKEFNKHKVAVYDNTGKMRNMADIIADLERALRGMSDEQKRTTLMAMGFQERSVSATMALLGTSEAIKKYEKQLRSAKGITEEVAKKQLDNFSDALGLLKDRIVATGIEIFRTLKPAIERAMGDGGTVDNAVKWVEKLAERFADLSDKEQAALLRQLAYAAAAGPVMSILGNGTIIIGGLVKAIGALVIGWGSLTTALGSGTLLATIGALMLALIPLALILAAIAATIKTLYLMKHPELLPITGGVKGLTDQLVQAKLDYANAATDYQRALLKARADSLRALGASETEALRTVQGLAKGTKDYARYSGRTRDQQVEDIRSGAKELPVWTKPVELPEKLAEGGIVTRPTNALIGERGPEAVIPLDRAGSMLGGGHYTMDINVKVTGGALDEDHLTRVASAGLMELIRRGDRRLPNRAALTGVTW